MKVTKKLKKVLCIGLAGGLILGCLAGCGDENKPAAKTMGQVTFAPQETGKPSAPQETEAPSAPSAPQETEAPSTPSAPQETEAPAAPVETEAPSAPPETSQTEGQTEDNTLDLSSSGNVTINGHKPDDVELDPMEIDMALWGFGTLFDNQYVQAWENYGRPANKNAFDINGTIIDAKTATEPKIIVDFDNGDTIDGLKAGSTYKDVFTAWGPCQSLRQSDNDIVLIFKHDTSLESMIPDQGFDGVEANVYLKLTSDLKDMVPYKVVVNFSVD